MKHLRAIPGYIALAIMAAGFVGMNITGIGERLHRNSVEASGVVVRGQIVDRLLTFCSGFRCSHRTTFDGEIGSAEYREFRSGCRVARRDRCRSDLLVHFVFAGQTRSLIRPVNDDDFERLREGSPVAVLVDTDDPAASLLRDFNPAGFLFFLAIGLDALVALLGLIIFGGRHDE